MVLRRQKKIKQYVPATDKPLQLEARNLSFHPGGQAIIGDISLNVSEGETVTIIGPNGSGKTTLLRLLLGLIPPTSGEVWRRPGLRVSYLPQKIYIDPVLPLSVCRMMRLTGSYPRKAVQAALEVTGVGHLIEHSVFNLSGGEFQRMMLARALLRDPELLVLDEPVQGVDYLGEADLYRLIGNIREHYHCSVLMVSHDLHVVMGSTDRVICIDHHICCQGKPYDVSCSPEYHRLFGLKDDDATRAVYQHKHDHKHDLAGNVVDEETQ